MGYICKLSMGKDSIYHIESDIEQMGQFVRKKEKEGFEFIGCYQSDEIQQIKENLNPSTPGLFNDAMSYNANTYDKIKQNGIDVTDEIKNISSKIGNK